MEEVILGAKEYGNKKWNDANDDLSALNIPLTYLMLQSI